jgi:hypothetical protein
MGSSGFDTGFSGFGGTFNQTDYTVPSNAAFIFRPPVISLSDTPIAQTNGFMAQTLQNLWISLGRPAFRIPT